MTGRSTDAKWRRPTTIADSCAIHYRCYGASEQLLPTRYIQQIEFTNTTNRTVYLCMTMHVMSEPYIGQSYFRFILNDQIGVVSDIHNFTGCDQPTPRANLRTALFSTIIVRMLFRCNEASTVNVTRYDRRMFIPSTFY